MNRLSFRNLIGISLGIGLFLIIAIFAWVTSSPILLFGLGIAVGAVALTIIKSILTKPAIEVPASLAENTAPEAQLDTVLDNVQIGFAVFDSEFRLLKWNNVFARMNDLKEEQLSGNPTLAELLILNYDKFDRVIKDRDEFINEVIEFASIGVVRSLDRHFKDGRIHEITFNGLPENKGYVCTYVDVTTNRHAEKALQENEDRYRHMVELSPDAIIAHKDGFIIYVNNAALKLLKEKSQYELIGKQIRTFFPTDDINSLTDHFGSAFGMETGHKLPAQKTSVITSDGVRTNVEVEASALMYGDKQVLQLIIRDISAQVQIQEFLEHAKEEAEYAAQLKGTFLTNMSHELRTPLNAVIGFSEVIKKEMFGPVGVKKYLEYAEDIRASGAHLLDLINDILDFSKIESGQQTINEEDIEIDILVNECVRLTQQRAIDNDINIKLEFDPLLPHIFGDRRMLKQILINLLSNAIKFTPAGGRIVTTVCKPELDGIKISVTDNGIGIREDDIEKALTPFVQIDSEKSRKYHGTGLGLPLSKNLAEMHEGSLELESKYGEGTVVSLILPKSRIRPPTNEVQSQAS